MITARKKLGDVLIEAGVISQEHLDKALQLQSAAAIGPAKGRRKRLGKTLIELGYLTEQQMAKALSTQLNLAMVDLMAEQIPDQIIQMVPRETAEREVLFPYSLQGKRLLVAMSDPLAWQAMDNLRFRLGFEVSPVVATESNILSAIEKYYKLEEAANDLLKLSPDLPHVEFLKSVEDEAQDTQALEHLSNAAPIVKLVTMLIMDAVGRRATDVHIEPRDNHVQVRYRIDGSLRDILKLPKQIHASVVSRIKIISSLDIASRLLPQDGSARMRQSGKEIDLRVSTLPAVDGEKVVIRILDKSRAIVPLAKLGVPDPIIKKLEEAVGRAQGMILVTGPTGSGKTTTLYALLQWLSDPSLNILTVEDPVEYKFAGITQVSVRDQIGLNFATVLRSALRQDPDIILVGEVRDLETAEIAIRAALTGHLVMTTLHTNDTVATVMRLKDLGVQPFLIASSMSGVLAQRLLRRICENCKEEDWMAPAPDASPPNVPKLAHSHKGRGCERCMFSGYWGQVGVYEYLEVSNQIKRLIADNASESALREEAHNMGMVTLMEDAWQKVNEGITTISEVLGKVPLHGPERGAGGTLPQPVQPSEESTEEQRSILVADRDEETLEQLRSTLDPRGYQVVPVSSGVDVYEAVCRLQPSLVFVNLDLPEMDGIGLIKKLKGNLPTATIPILVTSARTDKRAVDEGLRAGATEFITKPLSELSILARVERTLKCPI